MANNQFPGKRPLRQTDAEAAKAGVKNDKLGGQVDKDAERDDTIDYDEVDDLEDVYVNSYDDEEMLNQSIDDDEEEDELDEEEEDFAESSPDAEKPSAQRSKWDDA